EQAARQFRVPRQVGRQCIERGLHIQLRQGAHEALDSFPEPIAAVRVAAEQSRASRGLRVEGFDVDVDADDGRARSQGSWPGHTSTSSKLMGWLATICCTVPRFANRIPSCCLTWRSTSSMALTRLGVPEPHPARGCTVSMKKPPSAKRASNSSFHCAATSETGVIEKLKNGKSSRL